jgi:nitrite transporter
LYTDEVNYLVEISDKKIRFLNSGRLRYIISSALAGMYVGLGVALIFVIGGILNAVDSPATKIIMGISFGIALSLVLMAGSELFTGNNMIMTIGALEKKVTWMGAVRIWVYSFVGNLIGSIVLSLLFLGTGLASGHTAEYVVKIAAVKMNAPFIQLFIRGILCNILVCLAVWCAYKLKSEAAKLIMIFWCLFAFITTGYEHCVANMTLLSLALLIPHPAQISLEGFIYNLTASTLGNFIGGAVFMGAAYWYISRHKG